MKYLLLLIPFLLNAWSFTEKDFNNLTESQMDIINISYLVGEEKGYGLMIAAKSIVETRAGKIMGKTNHICGAHQVDITYSEATCKQLDNNPYISAKEALKNFLGWKTKVIEVSEGNYITVVRTDLEASRMYNVGYTNDPYGKEHVSRIELVLKVLDKYYKG